MRKNYEGEIEREREMNERRFISSWDDLRRGESGLL